MSWLIRIRLKLMPHQLNFNKTVSYSTTKLSNGRLILRKINCSALSGSRRLLLSVQMSPAVLNNRSLATLVGGGARHFWAKTLKSLNCEWFCRHQVIGSWSSPRKGSLKYLSISVSSALCLTIGLAAAEDSLAAVAEANKQQIIC